MLIAMSLSKLDHPIVFALSITLVVVGMISVLSWLFLALGWSGPLSVLKGGVANTGQSGVAPQ